MESYLEKAWGGSIENPSLDDIKIAILETINMDDEHGAFWIGIFQDNEFTLETSKDLTVIGRFTNNYKEQLRASFKDWSEIENLYKIFLSRDFNRVKSLLEANK